MNNFVVNDVPVVEKDEQHRRHPQLQHARALRALVPLVPVEHSCT